MSLIGKIKLRNIGELVENPCNAFPSQDSTGANEPVAIQNEPITPSTSPSKMGNALGLHEVCDENVCAAAENELLVPMETPKKKVKDGIAATTSRKKSLDDNADIANNVSSTVSGVKTTVKKLKGRIVLPGQQRIDEFFKSGLKTYKVAPAPPQVNGAGSPNKSEKGKALRQMQRGRKRLFKERTNLSDSTTTVSSESLSIKLTPPKNQRTLRSRKCVKKNQEQLTEDIIVLSSDNENECQEPLPRLKQCTIKLRKIKAKTAKNSESKNITRTNTRSKNENLLSSKAALCASSLSSDSDFQPKAIINKSLLKQSKRKESRTKPKTSKTIKSKLTKDTNINENILSSDIPMSVPRRSSKNEKESKLNSPKSAEELHYKRSPKRVPGTKAKPGKTAKGANSRKVSVLSSNNAPGDSNSTSSTELNFQSRTAKQSSLKRSAKKVPKTKAESGKKTNAKQSKRANTRKSNILLSSSSSENISETNAVQSKDNRCLTRSTKKQADNRKSIDNSNAQKIEGTNMSKVMVSSSDSGSSSSSKNDFQTKPSKPVKHPRLNLSTPEAPKTKAKAINAKKIKSTNISNENVISSTVECNKALINEQSPSRANSSALPMVSIPSSSPHSSPLKSNIVALPKVSPTHSVSVGKNSLTASLLTSSISTANTTDTKVVVHKAIPTLTPPPTSKRKQRPCPAYKVVDGTTFAVDAFQYGDIKGVTHYFLTHFHADHYVGLTSKFCMPLYLTPITARLVRAFIKVHPKYINEIHLNKPEVIEGVEVTAIDANHCPGAVMFVFKLPSGKCILHTGDFRASPQMESEPIFWNNWIDTIYLDTTYISNKYNFCAQSESIDRAIGIVEGFLEKHAPARILLVCGSYVIGKEKFWCALANNFKYKVWTEKNRSIALRAMDLDEMRDMLCDNPLQAQLHVISIGKLNYDSLLEYFESFKKHFDAVLALRPSGWEKNSRPQLRNPINIFGIEYSEHSSHDELERFVTYLKPNEVISTVPVTTSPMITSRIPMKWYKYERLTGRKRNLQPSITSYIKVRPAKKNSKRKSTNVATPTQLENTNSLEHSQLSMQPMETCIEEKGNGPQLAEVATTSKCALAIKEIIESTSDVVEVEQSVVATVTQLEAIVIDITTEEDACDDWMS